MKKRKIVTIAVLVIIIAGGITFFATRGHTEAVQWLTLPVSRGNVDVAVTATGTLQPDTTVQVGTQVSGTIAQLYVDWNSHVKRGQVVARLDTTFLWASVEQAEANLQKAQVAERQDKQTLDRTEKLFQRKLDSQQDYDNALAAYQTAKASVLQARTSLDQAQINLSYATIRSPISGVVISRAVDIGQTVAASFNTPTLFTVANSLSDMQVQASVDEGDIGNVKLGQRVTFTVDAYPNMVFSGTVKQIRLQPTTVQNVVEYTVIIDVPNPGLKLLPGMTANLTIHEAEAKDVLKVPTTALRFMPPPQYLAQMRKDIPDSVRKKFQARFKNFHPQNRGNGFPGPGGFGGGQGFGQGPNQGYQNRSLKPGSYFMVWVLNGNQIKPVRVQIGLSDGTNTQVDGDLKPGQAVVVGMLAGSAGAPRQNNPFMGRRF